MADYDLPVIESGGSSEPAYDKDTDMMIEPDGSKRQPSAQDDARLALQKYKEKNAPPDEMAPFREMMKKNGRTEAQIMRAVAEVESSPDPVARHTAMARFYGHDPRLIGQHMAQGISPVTEWQQSEGATMEYAGQEWRSRHPELHDDSPIVEDMKKIFNGIKGDVFADKRFKGCRTYGELLDRGHELAQQQTPKARILAQIEKKLSRGETIQLSRQADKATI
jgi:hypothetical protein